MFKKLKDKIAEEVKSSPSRIQQLAQVAQAAVSSASSTTSESVPSNDNFFSITEEDTPQNSPQRATTTKPELSPPTVNSNHLQAINNGGIPSTRVRKLSNSSLASDVSFRLPTYESSPAYNFPSDASDIDDSASTSGYEAHLDMISKEKMYDAYKKSLERYQKYRGRYTELVRRYRDLERDNNKARAVLVETQDKALRRIGELREQCSLEQQAKAHLESALRMDMDEQQCVIKTLKEKLSLLGENPEEIVRNEKDSNLIQLTDNGVANLIEINDDDGAAVTTTEKENLIVSGASIMINDSNEKIKILDAQLAAAKAESAELNRKHESALKRIKELIAREEENTILLAQNKLAIHEELEKKEKEMKSLKAEAKQSASETECLNEIVTELREQNSRALAQLKDLSEAKQTLEQRLDEMKKSAQTFEGDLKELQAKVIVLDSEKQSITSRTQTEMEKFKARYDSLLRKNEQLEELNRTKVMETHEKIAAELKHEKDAHAEVSRQLSEQIAKVQSLEHQLQDALRDHRETVQRLNENVDAAKADKMKLENRFKQLFEEKQSLVTQTQTDKDEIDKLRALINATPKTDENVVDAVDNEQTTAIDELNERIKTLVDEQTAIRDQLKHEQREKNDALTDVTNLKSKVEMLKNEKRDLEKTLEKEIRDKTELQTQVTNILNEIGRLEDQLKEVKQSYAELEQEKAAVEARSHNANDAEALALADKVNDLEAQIALLHEQNHRLQSEQIDADDSLKLECERLQEKLKQSLDEYAVLFNTKEQMDQEHRSLLDQLETKEKEKLCAISANEILESDLAKLREELNQRQHLEEEKTQLSTECDRLRADLDSTRTENEQLVADKSELSQQVDRLSTELSGMTSDKDKLQQTVDYLTQQANDDRDLLNETLQKMKTLEHRLESSDQIKIENEFLDKSVKQVESDLRRVQEEKESMVSEIVQLKEKLKSQQCELYVLAEQQESFAKKDFEIEQLKEICQRSQMCSEDLQLEIQRKAQQIDTLKSLSDETIDKLDKLQKKFDSLSHDRQSEQKTAAVALEEKQRAHDDLTKRLATLEREIDSSRAIINDLNADLNVQSNKCIDFESKYSDSQIKITELDTELTALKAASKNNDAADELETLREDHEKLKSELADTKSKTEREIAELKVEITEYEDNAKLYQEVQMQLVDLTTKNATLSQEVNTLKSQLDEESERSEEYEDAANESVGLKQQLEQVKLEKDDIDSKLTTILNEVQDVSNRNLFLEQKCENFLILEQSNERLKLQNAKLLRQLDETLVSLQHTEGITANTEFEYLKNIMFQYLTNNINSNGSTLIKVIAAVLKFSPQQTQVALERETHRKTLMGQINNLL